jgi:hypothetical protein
MGDECWTKSWKLARFTARGGELEGRVLMSAELVINLLLAGPAIPRSRGKLF